MRHHSLLESLETRLLMRASVRPILTAPAPAKAPHVATVVRPTQGATSMATVADVSSASDTITFGNTTSETSHSFVGNSTQTITGGLSQPARQLLPLPTVSVNGGDLTFTMNVDPTRLNYFTIKLWGGDTATSNSGRLYLYIPVNGTNYQVGYRHEGDYVGALSVATDTPPLPGRFFYSTTELPLSMTQGKTSITLKIISTGRIYDLGTGDQNSGGNYQYNMNTPSRGIYAAYTHVDPLLDVSGEVQGSMPAASIRPSPTVSVLQSGGAYYNNVANYIQGMLNTTTSVSNLTTAQALYLAKAYSVSALSSFYHSAVIVSKIIAIIDAYATDYLTTPANVSGGSQEGWGGRYGNLGEAIDLLSKAGVLPASTLDASVNYGSTGGTQTRRAAWGTMLQASRDYGRFNRDSWYITNQNLLANTSIYEANRGLLAIGNANAFTETAAQRYVLEAAGLQPWLGSDLATGGSSFKFGQNYYQVTAAGLTREWGYVASNYGELSGMVADLYTISGNTAFKTQAIKMLNARAAFRKPAVDANGYQEMQEIGLLAWRGATESDGEFVNEAAYGDRSGNASGMHTAAVTMDPTAIGYAKQMLADNQFFQSLLNSDTRTYTSIDSMDVFADYAAVAAAADSGARLPMTDGQPDFVWSDPDDGIVAIKHGTDRLWVAPYYQAKTGTGVNGIARFEYSTPQGEQYGILQTDAQYAYSGSYYVRPNYVDKPEGNLYTPPDNPTQAYAGQVVPIVASADPSTVDDTPYRGKASFYAFRIGNYLVGINTTADTTYTLKTPAGVTSATDLATNTTLSGTINVAPGKTVVLYLASATDAAPVPAAPTGVIAKATRGRMTLTWSPSNGATGYSVKRSTTRNGPYTTVATNLTASTFTNTGLTVGRSYYYVVTATNASGESYNSAETIAGLPAALSNADIGSPALAGTSYQDNGKITVSGSGADIGGTSDQFQFAYTQATGDTTLIARIDPMNTNGVDKAGIMIRQSLAANSKLVAVILQPNGVARLAARLSTGANMAYGATFSPITGRYWVKLVRSGSTISASISPDGMTWTSIGVTSLSFTGSIYIGLASCSLTTQQTSAAVFDNVQLGSTDLTAPTLVAASSRKTQGSAGTFDVPIALGSATPTIEPRLGGASALVYTFNEPVVAADGVLDATEFDISNASFASATVSGVTLTLNLANVIDQARTTVTLQNMTDSTGNPLDGNLTLVVRSLYGDVNQSGSVSVADQQAVKNGLFADVSMTNYLMDLNLSGTISVSDQQAVKNSLFDSVD